jgi:BirA family transcriptional regulator, biotin operon repressor / biotin---[acetyl-CoA-carboxylase] ligase
MLFKNGAVIQLDSVDSTNNYAANLLKLSTPPEGTVITAQFQTGGRGQRGAIWESKSGDNLLCSVVLYPTFLNAGSQFYLNIAVSLALREMIEDKLNKETFIKWPNDILVNQKKMAGILIEANWNENRLTSAIIGLGLNLNQTHFAHPKATSARAILGVYQPIDQWLEAWLIHLEKYYFKLRSLNTEELHKIYESYLFGWKKTEKFIYQSQEIEAEIKGIDKSGKLCLHKTDGQIITCDLKEISMIY